MLRRSERLENVPAARADRLQETYGGPMKWIRSHLKIVIPAAVAVVAVGAYVAFGVFGVQFLFIDDTVDEAAPVFDSGAGAEPAAVTETTAVTSVAPATTRPAESPSTDDGSGIQTPETTVAPKLRMSWILSWLIQLGM